MADFQPTLSNGLVLLRPLLPEDFPALYLAASDPLVWEQHPNPDRYKEEVFRNYFDHAIASGGALAICDAGSGRIIGSSRYYDHRVEEASVFIGYTFFSRECWGGRYNYSAKWLMLDHVFSFVDAVYFHVGMVNVRSQKSIERMGVTRIREIEVAYAGEAVRPNIEYRILREDWPAVSVKVLSLIQS